MLTLATAFLSKLAKLGVGAPKNGVALNSPDHRIPCRNPADTGDSAKKWPTRQSWPFDFESGGS